MAKPRGFTVLELVIVVAVLGIVAAITIPALVRSRVAANESATIGDLRTLHDAQEAYRSVNGGLYDSNLDCLLSPSTGCIPSYPSSAPTFLDSQLASTVSKSGYNRLFAGGPPPANLPPTVSQTSTDRYRYDTTPVVVGVTGVRGFATDASGRICFTFDGMPIPAGVPTQTLPLNCRDLR